MTDRDKITDMERPKIEAHLAEVYTAALGIRTTDLAVLAEGVWRLGKATEALKQYCKVLRGRP
jgi:hypothetical protein